MALAGSIAGCNCGEPPPVWEPTPYALEIPPFFPPMDIPADNPLTVEGVHLGRMLFWETRLSQDNSMSCGNCHLPESNFSDPEPYSTGVTGAIGSRNAMALINLGWASSFFWDGRAVSLEDQIRDPVPHPDEMNLPWAQAVERLQNDNTDTNYPSLFFDAFGTTEITENLVVMAIAQFIRTMISADSKFDRWRRGELELTDSEYNGYQMFLREGGDPRWSLVANLAATVFTVMERPDFNSRIICSTTTVSMLPLNQTLDVLPLPEVRSILDCFGRPPFGTSPFPPRTCMTGDFKRLKKSSSITIQEVCHPRPSIHS